MQACRTHRYVSASNLTDALTLGMKFHDNVLLTRHPTTPRHIKAHATQLLLITTTYKYWRDGNASARYVGNSYCNVLSR
jgi:hypothetical protein